MQPPLLHKFQIGERRFVIDPDTCFCFECDHISWDVLEYYPREPLNRIYHLLEGKHPRKELEEVVGELEWLRVTKAILTSPTDETLMKEALDAPGLRRIIVSMDAGASSLQARVTQAGNVLLAASGTRKDITLLLAFSDDADRDIEAVAASAHALKQAALFAEKKLCVAIETPLQAPRNEPEGAARYRLQAVLRENADLASRIREVMALRNSSFEKVADALQKSVDPERAVVVAHPNSARFHDMLKMLYEAGYRDTLLDIPDAYGATPQRDHAAIAEALTANATYYAKQLLQGRYFRAEPFATLFNAVHQGNPLKRVDDAGTEELAVDAAGRVFPSPDFMREAAFQVGVLPEGRRDENALRPFAHFGAAQMPVCRQCWARCLCAGGYAFIHWRLTGDPRTPDPAWCEGQRQWLAHVIDAFNTLAAAGVNFSHIAGAMVPGVRKKMSWLQAAKTAYQMRIIPRPLQESDADWLVQWENWNSAAYFVCNESGLLLAARYDREMDALHPRDVARELALTRHNGQPLGLLKIRPDTTGTGLAWAWLYMRDSAVYAESGVRRALRALLAETSRSHELQRILVPVTVPESELADCLQAIGFRQHGTQRQALYLHGEYRDVQIFLYEA